MSDDAEFAEEAQERLEKLEGRINEVRSNPDTETAEHGSFYDPSDEQSRDREDDEGQPKDESTEDRD